LSRKPDDASSRRDDRCHIPGHEIHQVCQPQFSQGGEYALSDRTTFGVMQADTCVCWASTETEQG
jgi:hypothetical protein